MGMDTVVPMGWVHHPVQEPVVDFSPQLELGMTAYFQKINSIRVLEWDSSFFGYREVIVAREECFGHVDQTQGS